MKLENLRPNFLEMSDEERFANFEFYCRQRLRDLEERVIEVPKKQAKERKKSDRKIPVTPEELSLLRKIGLI